MKLQYRIGAALASGALFVSLMSPAAYADNTCTNRRTGNNSTNICKNKVENNFTNRVKNKSKILNDLYLKLKTGGNDANNNTGDGTATGGAITVNINIHNNVNQNGDPGPTPTPEPTPLEL